MRQGVFGGARDGVAPDGRAGPAPLRLGGSPGDIPGTGAPATAESTTGPNGAGHPRIGSGGTVLGTDGRGPGRSQRARLTADGPNESHVPWYPSPWASGRVQSQTPSGKIASRSAHSAGVSPAS